VIAEMGREKPPTFRHQRDRQPMIEAQLPLA